MTAARLRTLAACLAGLLVLVTGPAAAEMRLDRSILVFDADSAPRQDVEVANTGDEVLYLDTEILTVVNPGTDDERREVITDPDALTLLVTPARAIVQPGGRQLIRIVLLEDPGDSDRVHRVNVRPVLPPLEADQSAVKVVVAYQLLIIQRPENPNPDLRWERDGKTIRFENAGNSNILLFNGRQCLGEEDCIDLGVARRLYAGNRWTVDLPLDAPVEFTAGVGDTNARRRFD